MAEILFRQESYDIIGVCFEVPNGMGCGFLEAVYQECLEIELRNRPIPIVSQHRLNLQYKSQPLKSIYVPDLICFGSIIVGLKALCSLNSEHQAQVHNYLKATSLRLALLINFGHHPKLQYERIVR